MTPLDKDLRNLLERTVKAGRTVAETAAEAALGQLGVGSDRPEAYLADGDKALRRALRIHGKQLGDLRDTKGTNPVYGVQEVGRLTQEVAYQHWHRMLFARFLAENALLMFDGVPVTLEECDELAADPDVRPAAKSGWELAGKLAARMLPQVFKPGSPVFQVVLAPEHQGELERLVKALPGAVFLASDSLGWVYQFWQADQKDRINKSEVKIGADELPAVTQLFTEPYMVSFLLHNSLGAWWATRHPERPCPIDLDYFRTLEDGTPAAGKFEGWPDSLADFTLLDPCCGSGHFLVAAFLMLVPMRMAAEDLEAKEAVDRVLADNIHGLEIDPRCVEIAVFAVALEAWRYPDAQGRPLGVRPIPAPHIACCGLKVAAKVEDWQALVPDDSPKAAYLREGLARLHKLFAQAPLLGSLLDPSRHEGDLFGANYQELSELMKAALGREAAGRGDDGEERWDSALSALGLLDAARLLDSRYHLVVTNVPYLARGRQGELLRTFCETYYFDAKGDIANVFLERCSKLGQEGDQGVVQTVMPQNWLFLKTYEKHRRTLLKNVRWNCLVRLGTGAFETITGEVVQAILLTQTNALPSRKTLFYGLDVSEFKDAHVKARMLHDLDFIVISQPKQLTNPDARIILGEISELSLLEEYAHSSQGITTGDNPRYIQCYWERHQWGGAWKSLQSTPNSTMCFGGREQVFLWENGNGSLARSDAARVQGQAYWSNEGVAIRQMGELPATFNSGSPWDMNSATIIPHERKLLSAIWCFCSSFSFNEAVRHLDQKRNVTNATLVKVPFDLAHWQEVAAERYPNGLPKPYSDDPTQWLFHGHPQPATDPLQVALARLVGYTWPAESDKEMELSDEAHAWIAKSQTLAGHADDDGIVCIPPVGQEASAADRLLNLLAEAYGADWTNDVLPKLLAGADHADKSLETWLRDKAFGQHTKLFNNRPFVWHIWDGLSDGFAALVNYHKLDFKTLEALIYTYLGDWMTRQKRDIELGVDGAQGKLAAAEVLKSRLESILKGEAPYDIFVRWKPVDEQAIGWNPDLNDGVRLNIRPFLSVPDIGKKGAGVLREKPNIKWDKDRGKDVESAPWYTLGLQYDGKEGDRINDHHLSLAEKAAAQKAQP